MKSETFHIQILCRIYWFLKLYYWKECSMNILHTLDILPALAELVPLYLRWLIYWFCLNIRTYSLNICPGTSNFCKLDDHEAYIFSAINISPVLNSQGWSFSKNYSYTNISFSLTLYILTSDYHWVPQVSMHNSWIKFWSFTNNSTSNPSHYHRLLSDICSFCCQTDQWQTGSSFSAVFHVRVSKTF